MLCRCSLLFCIVIISFVAGCTVWEAHGDVLSDYKLHNVQKELIMKALKELSAKPQLTEKEENKLELYNTAQKFIDRAKLAEERLATIKREMLTMPEAINKLKTRLNGYVEVTSQRFVLRYASQALDALELQLVAKQEKLVNEQKALSTLSQKVAKERLLPEKNQKQLYQDQQRLINLQKQLTQLDAESERLPVFGQKKLLLAAEISFLEIHKERLKIGLQRNGVHLEYLSLQHQFLSLQVNALELETEYLQQLINKKRKEASQALAENHEQNEQSAPKSLLLKRLSAENAEFSQALVVIADRISELTDRSKEVRNNLNLFVNIRNEIDQQLSIFGKSILLARVLRESLRHLPDIVEDKQISETLTETRLQKFQYDQLRQKTLSVSFLSKKHDLTPKEKEEMKLLLASRWTLLDKLSQDSNKLLTGNFSLQVEQQRLYSLSRDLYETLQKKLFWVTSSPPLGISWLLGLPEKVWSEFSVIPWQQGIETIYVIVMKSWWMVLSGLLLCLWMLLRRKTLLSWQKAMIYRIGHIKRDALWLTPLAMFLSLCYVVPVALLIIVFALLFSLHAMDPSWVPVGYSIVWAGVTWIIFAFLRHLVKPSGIANAHFQWTAQYCYRLNQQLRHLSPLLVFLVFVVNFVENQTRQLDQDVLGMIVLMLGSIVQAICIFSLLKHTRPLLGSKISHAFMLLLLPGLSLVQALLIFTGYYYSALVLEHQIIVTLLLIAGFSLLQALAIRSINIGEHRLAYQRAVKKYMATDNQPFEEPALDLATVNQQSLRLLNAALIVGFAILFYWVWKNFASIFSSLGAIELWSYTHDYAVRSISLSHILLSGLILATTFILARNLPGLLEITLLSKLKIPQGNSYAAMTLLSYSITLLGIVFTLSSLGLSWEKLQWLVAAVGLGMSIGLREVFANMLSGLIILFERPIRIGDTISLGDMIGEVSCIRVRATTILDWDHREIIVPNSMLLNDKLVNWSLSNSVVRIILPFHVEHEADPTVVERLLLRVCKEHPLVVDMPQSVVTLIEYGDSALFYEMRTFISVDDRLLVRNEINKRVTALFAEHGIKVAPQKRMIYMKSTHIETDP